MQRNAGQQNVGLVTQRIHYYILSSIHFPNFYFTYDYIIILTHRTEVKIYVHIFLRYSVCINTSANNSREIMSSASYTITPDLPFSSLPYLICRYVKDNKGRNIPKQLKIYKV